MKTIAIYLTSLAVVIAANQQLVSHFYCEILENQEKKHSEVQKILEFQSRYIEEHTSNCANISLREINEGCVKRVKNCWLED